MISVAKSSVVLAVTHAVRPEQNDIAMTLMPPRQQDMDRVSNMSELTQFSEQKPELMTAIEAHIDQQTEASCSSAATINAKASLAELSASAIASAMAPLMAFGGDRFFAWAHNNAKPGLAKVVAEQASGKNLKRLLEVVYTVISDEQNHLSDLQELLNKEVDKINHHASNTAHGSFEKLSFHPSLQFHLRDGRAIHPIDGLRLKVEKLTADSQMKAVQAIAREIRKTKDKKTEDGTDRYPEGNITNFGQWYAEQFMEHGAFRKEQLTAIGKDLGVPSLSSLTYGWFYEHGLDMMKRLARGLPREFEKMETRRENQDQQDFRALMSASEKEEDPMPLLIQMASELEKEGTIGEENAKVLQFVDDLPIAAGWLLKDDKVVESVKKVIADIAEYLSEHSLQPELVRMHADETSVLEVGQDLTLAPEQIRMIECQVNRFMQTGLKALTSSRDCCEDCGKCCECCKDIAECFKACGSCCDGVASGSSEEAVEVAGAAAHAVQAVPEVAEAVAQAVQAVPDVAGAAAQAVPEVAGAAAEAVQAADVAGAAARAAEVAGAAAQAA